MYIHVHVCAISLFQEHSVISRSPTTSVSIARPSCSAKSERGHPLQFASPPSVGVIFLCVWRRACNNILQTNPYSFWGLQKIVACSHCSSQCLLVSTVFFCHSVIYILLPFYTCFLSFACTVSDMYMYIYIVHVRT